MKWKDDDILYWPRLKCEIYSPGNGHDHNELTLFANISLFFFPSLIFFLDGPWLGLKLPWIGLNPD